MRLLTLYISVSADGMLARSDGTTDWQIQDPESGFEAFYKEIDTIFMGRGCFENILNQGPWPYEDKMTYVFSKTLRNEFGKRVSIISRDPGVFVDEYKESEGSKIWLMGGPTLIRALMQQNLVDIVTLNIHPTILGQGLSLFPLPLHSMFWKLVSSQEFSSGLVQTKYALRTHEISG
ncbi:MAG: dihydrofolate reductase family protein [Bdellovibrionales bacterium]